jgi:hypothetical protein
LIKKIKLYYEKSQFKRVIKLQKVTRQAVYYYVTLRLFRVTMIVVENNSRR